MEDTDLLIDRFLTALRRSLARFEGEDTDVGDEIRRIFQI